MPPKSRLPRSLLCALILVTMAVGLFAGTKYIAGRDPGAPVAPASTAVPPVPSIIATPGGQAQVISPPPNVAAATHGPRGYLTTPDELVRSARAASAGSEPARSAVADLLRYAKETQGKPRLRAPSTIKGDDSSIDSPEFLATGSKYVYAWAIAYHLLRESDPEQAEGFAADALEMIMALPERGTRIDEQEPNTRLVVSVYLPNFIYAADLLASWPLPDSSTPFAESSGAQEFKAWLGAVALRSPYLVAHTRVNNWGAWGRLATAVIADYVGDAAPLYVPGIVEGEDGAYRVSSRASCSAGKVADCLRGQAGEIYARALGLHLAMVDGQLREFSETSCDANGSKSMIRPDGGLPDELRREFDCDSPDISTPYGPASRYSQFSLEAMISLAELSWRRGTADLYGHIDPESGRGALFRALEFLISNNVQFTRSSMLEMANRYYSYQLRSMGDDPRRPEYQRLVDHNLPAILRDQDEWPAGVGFVSFGTLTHGFSPAEELAPPPVVAPRSPAAGPPRTALAPLP